MILVAFAVCTAPIKVISQITQLFPVFEADTWKVLTTTIAQTADTYGHAQPDRHESAVNALDQFLKG